jgi:glycosyltransferase involved in cell wall biosynthesis
MNTENNHIITLTTVTPVFGGEKTLPKLVTALASVRDNFENRNYPFRIRESIFVDDGSIDGSAMVLNSLRMQYPWLKVVTLSNNFGQHPATIAGILHSDSDWVVTLDEDLQHAPEHIYLMLKTGIHQGADIVYAKAENSVHGSVFRDWSSRFLKIILARLTGNSHMRIFSSFRLIRGSIARAASAVSGTHTYFDVVLCWFTARVTSVDLLITDYRFRETGRSGYSFIKLLKHAGRLIQSSRLRVLGFGVFIGLLTMMLGITGAIAVLIVKLYYPHIILVGGWTSSIIITLILSGLIAFLVSLILQNLSILVQQVHGKPKFFEIDRSNDIVLLDWFHINDK